MHNEHQTSPDRQEVSQRANDFWNLLAAHADCTPRGRRREQEIRNRQNIIVAPSSNPAPQQHAFDI